MKFRRPDFCPILFLGCDLFLANFSELKISSKNAKFSKTFQKSLHITNCSMICSFHIESSWISGYQLIYIHLHDFFHIPSE